MKKTAKSQRGARPTHGESVKGKESVEYRAWSRMKDRCTNEQRDSHHRYGGRGIAVCARWTSSFQSFLADMGRRPGPGYSLDRIDNDGNYEPGNVRWATRREQSMNYSRNRRVTVDGRTLTVSEWSAETGLNETTIASRLDRGWLAECAVGTPVGVTPSGAARRNAIKTHCPQGHEYSAANTYLSPSGSRICRICNRLRARKKIQRVI